MAVRVVLDGLLSYQVMQKRIYRAVVSLREALFSMEIIAAALVYVVFWLRRASDQNIKNTMLHKYVIVARTIAQENGQCISRSFWR